MTTRAEKLRAVRVAHGAWVAGNLAAVPFVPSGGSVFNQHYVDLDAGGAAQDEFAAAVATILGTPTVPTAVPSLLAAADVHTGAMIALLPSKADAKFNPGQERDENGRWTDGGVSILSLDEYESTYGESIDEASIDTELYDRPLTVRYFANGDSHIVLDHPDDGREVLQEVGNGDAMRELHYDLLTAADADLADFDDADGEGFVEQWLSDHHDLRVSLYDTGDVNLRASDVEGDKGFDLSNQDARDLAVILEEMADLWDEEFLESGDPIDVDSPVSNRAVPSFFAAARLSQARLTGKFNPDQLRGDDGKWTDGVPGSARPDKLAIAGRIPLGPGESLVASNIFEPTDGALLPIAVTRDTTGQHLRMGVTVSTEDRKRWAGRNLGSTINLDENGIGQLKTALSDMNTRGAEVGQTFRDAEDRAEELDQEWRDVSKRQYSSLSKSQGKRLDQIDRRLEGIEESLASNKESIRNSEKYLDEYDPDGRQRWDEIKAEIAGLDPEEDLERIEALQMEQAKMLPSPKPNTLAKLRAAGLLGQERDELLAERAELTANAAPLLPEDQAALEAIGSDIAENEALLGRLRETTVVSGVIPGKWVDLAYEVTTHETTYDYDHLGVGYRIAPRPHTAMSDWAIESDEATYLEPQELLGLSRMLDRMTSDNGGIS